MNEMDRMEEIIKELEEESKKRGLKIPRNDLRLIAADWLKSYGEGLD